MIKRDYCFCGEEGFHARPVSEFVKISKQFDSEVQLAYDGEEYDGKSAISIMCGCIEDGCRFSMTIDGPDEGAALAAIEEHMVTLNGYFLPAQEESARPQAAESPAAARPEECIPLSPGYAIGTAHVIRRDGTARTDTTGSPEEETARLERAVQSLAGEMRDSAQRAQEPDVAEILRAHVEILTDEILLGEVKKRIREKDLSAAAAVKDVSEDLQRRFEALASGRMRERAADIKDVSLSLIDALTGSAHKITVTEENTILVADELLPSDTMRLDRSKVAGFITERGGANCHSAIVARSMGIPAISNVEGAAENIPDGARVIIDGERGLCYIDPCPALIEEYEKKLCALESKKREERKYISMKTVTSDGVELELAANLLDSSELKNAVEQGAEGVGLFRTEFLYMNRQAPPTLEEQFECYKSLLENANGLPVTIRTLDAGGDKPVASLGIEKEDNAFLGVRAIRFCLRNEDIFRTQLRALLMASAHGDLRIMIPMVTDLNEVMSAVKCLNEEKARLVQMGNKVGDYQFGVMIETPAAVVMSGEIAELADFFSLGTNDLTQYVMAADRTSAALSELNSPYQPAVLRMISYAAKAAREKGIWAGVCGESGSNPLLAPLYAAMGIRELSMNPAAIPGIRAALSRCSCQELSAKTGRVLAARTASEAEERLKELLEEKKD